MNSFLEFFTFENSLFVAGMFGFFSILLSWHLNKNNSIDLKTILVKDGELSLSKLGQLIALLVSTWIIVYQTRAGLLTEFVFTGYMVAWSGANLASKWIDRGNTSTYRQTSIQTHIDSTEPDDTADFRDFRSSQVQKRNP